MNKITALCFFVALIFHSSCYTQDTGVISISDDIHLIALKDSVFIHVSYHSADGFGRFPSNGLLIIKNGKALMIDTPMDNLKTRMLLDYLNDTMEVQVSRFIAGHFHADCIGGLTTIQNDNIENLANIRTIELCKEYNLPVPANSFTDSLIIDHEGKKVICNYPGPGHSEDNIVVWLPGDKILFGGCLVKSAGSRNLGNLEDANVNKWDKTLKNLLDLYPGMKIVVPGHGSAGGKELIHHTLNLVKEYKKNSI
jgi:metallo-beta-lactamase class B